jgi:hypothetical protein
MGTRGEIVIKIKGRWYLIYNHFDSYPSGLLRILIEQMKDYDKIKENYENQIVENGGGTLYQIGKNEMIDNCPNTKSLNDLKLSEFMYFKDVKQMFKCLEMCDHEYTYYIDFDLQFIGCSHICLEPVIVATSDTKNEKQMEEMYNLFCEIIYFVK